MPLGRGSLSLKGSAQAENLSSSLPLPTSMAPARALEDHKQEAQGHRALGKGGALRSEFPPARLTPIGVAGGGGWGR